MITLEHVTKRFGRFTAIDDVTETIGGGESVALWGANGAGKTSLLRCILGLYRFAGRIRVCGEDVGCSGKAARRLIGYVPQELGFSDDTRVEDAIRLFGGLKGVRRCSPASTLAAVGLRGEERKRVRELSGGMKQRLALGLAMLGDPPVLILDEVTASLDSVGREEFVHLLASLAKEGKTMLFASHREEEITTLASRVLVMERGKVVRDVSSAEFAGGRTADGQRDAGDEQVVLRVRLDKPTSLRAINELRIRGHEAFLNGVGILIPVSHGRKAAAIQALARASIQVNDFEFVDRSAFCARGGGTQEASQPGGAS